MKVLHVYKTYLPDSFTGIERVIWEIAEGTVSHGIETTVYSLSGNPSNRLQPIDNHFGFTARRDLHLASNSMTLTGFGQFARLAAQADLVHYHFPWPMMDLLHLISRMKKPSLVTYHSDIVRQKRILRFYRPLMLRFLGDMKAIVATSPDYVRSSDVLQRFPEKVSVIPIGLDPSRQPTASQEKIESWRRHVGDTFFLFVGAFRYYKGLGYLMDAARKTGLPVVLAGGDELDPEFGPVPDNVRIVGKVSAEDKAALLALSLGFVFPSHLRSEAFGIALLEAAFAGKPMISCGMGTGTSYVNAHGETGLVVPPADSEALAQAMTTLAADGDLRERAGRNALKRANELFLASQMADDYAELYKQVFEQSGAEAPKRAR